MCWFATARTCAWSSPRHATRCWTLPLTVLRTGKRNYRGGSDLCCTHHQPDQCALLCVGSVKNRAGAKTLERYAQLAAVLLRLPEELITLSDWRAPSSGSDNDVSWL